MEAKIIIENSGTKLTLRTPVWRRLAVFLANTGFFFVMCFVFLPKLWETQDNFPRSIGELVNIVSSGSLQQKGTYLFLIAFAIFTLVVPSVRLLLSLFSPNNILLDREMQEISQRGKRIGDFTSVRHVQIRHIERDESADQYRLSIRWSDQRKLHIFGTTDQEYIERIGGDIADFLNRPLKQI